MELAKMFDDIKKKLTERIIYLKPTIIFLFLSFVISFPLYYFAQLFNTGIAFYSFISYFIVIISMSISFHYCFKDEWKFKIGKKSIIVYILLYVLILYYIFNVLNGLLGINNPEIAILIIPPFFLLFMELNSFSPLILTKWIFRCFEGKGLTYEKKMDSLDDFKSLTQLIEGSYIKIGDSILIYHNSSSNFPSYFLNYDKEKGIAKLQLSNQKWFSFSIDEKTKKFGHLFESFGFKYVGENVIKNDIFVSKLDYPIFSKSRVLGLIWIFVGTFSIFINMSKRNGTIFFEVPGKFMVYYSQFNQIAKENPLIVPISFFLLGLLINKFQYIQSALENWSESLKKI
ncbi:MAG: hypothetical protein O8C61_12600 [Candidatus Methanoperedens sp.]|nr:hypothetical protein [Candidatus Methanoperedens sp.]